MNENELPDGVMDFDWFIDRVNELELKNETR